MSDDAVLFTSIDGQERDYLRLCADTHFGVENRIEELIWVQNTTHSQSPLYSTNHEYIEVYGKSRVALEAKDEVFQEGKPGYKEIMDLVSELNPNYPSPREVKTKLLALFAEHRAEFERELDELGLPLNDETKRLDPWRGIYNYNNAEYRDEKGNLVAPEEAERRKPKLVVWREDNTAAPSGKQSPTTRDEDSLNYRYYKPIHPKTGKPSPHPKTGWRYPQKNDPNDPKRASFESLDKENLIVWGDDENNVPQVKRFLHT